jgi:hypothetical protein
MGSVRRSIHQYALKSCNVGQVGNLPPIVNRRKLARVNNPQQVVNLPHSPTTICGSNDSAALACGGSRPCACPANSHPISP